MPYIDTVGDTRLFYKDLGAGPPVMLLHSWSLSSTMWEYQIPTLVEAGYRVIAVDRRGHGRSDVPGSGYDLDTLADDLAAVVAKLELQQVSFVAHSMGTCEVTRFLSRHGSSRASRVVFIGAMTPYLAGAVGAAFVEGTIDEIHADRPAWFHAGVDGYFARPASGVSQALADDGLATILGTPLEVQAACMRAFALADLTEELRALDVPALVIHGELDASAPIEITGCATADLLPNARFERYEGGPHGLYVTHRERLAKDLLAFLPDAAPC